PLAPDIAASRAAGAPLVTDGMKLERGDVAAGLAGAKHRITGSMEMGGQDHFYLEGQIAMALPGEDDEVTVYSSTQHPSEVQHMVGHALGVPSNSVNVVVRRMDGGLGGKQTQGNLFVDVASNAAKEFQRPVKIRHVRDDDMIA